MLKESLLNNLNMTLYGPKCIVVVYHLSLKGFTIFISSSFYSTIAFLWTYLTDHHEPQHWAAVF